MGIVVILDQQMSRRGPDRVGEAADRLSEALGPGLLLPPVRTAGDEMQAIIGQPYVLPKLVELSLRWKEWWLGIGVGHIDFLGETSRDSRGPAFRAARDAIEKAKRRRNPPVAVSGDLPVVCERLQGMCDVLAFLLERRTKRQWEVIDVTRARGSGSKAAALLGISPQSANEVLRSAAYREQVAVEEEITYLAAEGLQRTDADA